MCVNYKFCLPSSQILTPSYIEDIFHPAIKIADFS